MKDYICIYETFTCLSSFGPKSIVKSAKYLTVSIVWIDLSLVFFKPCIYMARVGTIPVNFSISNLNEEQRR